MFDANKQHRRSIRLAEYDYRAAGAYFVTICTHQKKCVFSRVLDDTIRTNAYGKIIENCWSTLPKHFSHITLDEWIVMPNHFHGILIFNNADNTRRGMPQACPNEARQFGDAQAGSLSVIISQFKMHATRSINNYRIERDLLAVKVWQRNFFERIIRDERELFAARRYIIENPARWNTDHKILP